MVCAVALVHPVANAMAANGPAARMAVFRQAVTGDSMANRDLFYPCGVAMRWSTAC